MAISFLALVALAPLALDALPVFGGYFLLAAQVLDGLAKAEALEMLDSIKNIPVLAT